MNDRDLIEAFESCALPASEFPHAAHVQLTHAYLERDPLPAVMIKLRDGIRRFAEHNGASSKYHETITFAFAALINERRLRTTHGASFEAFRSANPDLFDKAILEAYYKKETLASDAARSFFVLPDRAIGSR